MFLDRLVRILALLMIVLDSCNSSQLQDSCVALALHLGRMALDFLVFKKISNCQEVLDLRTTISYFINLSGTSVALRLSIPFNSQEAPYKTTIL